MAWPDAEPHREHVQQDDRRGGRLAAQPEPRLHLGAKASLLDGAAGRNPSPGLASEAGERMHQDAVVESSAATGDGWQDQ